MAKHASKSKVDTLLTSAVAPVKKVRTLNWKFIGIVALVAVLLVGLFIGFGVFFQKQYDKELAEQEGKESKEGMTYFTADQTEPEKKADELTSLITEACYTNDGSLKVDLCFANGMEKDQHLTSVAVEIRNGEGKVVAKGYSDDISKTYRIPAGGTETLILYVSPEYVTIKDDSLATLSYDVTTRYEPIG